MAKGGVYFALFKSKALGRLHGARRAEISNHSGFTVLNGNRFLQIGFSAAITGINVVTDSEDLELASGGAVGHDVFHCLV